MQIKKAFWSISLSLFLVACASNPVTGKRDLVFMSAADEIAIGEKNYLPAQQQQGGEYSVDENLSVYVFAVGKKLAAVSDRPNLPYEFVVLNNNVPNAWALPGGKIALNRGLLVHLKDEAQLAAVLAHEIVHAAARHGAQQQSQNILVNVGIAATAVVAQRNNKYGGAAVIAAGIGSKAWMARYSRGNESESDRYGIAYMSKAGYEPMAAVEIQQVFVKLSGGKRASWFDEFFASHPPSPQRVEANKKTAAKYPAGKRNKAAFEQAMKQLRKDQQAYEALQKGEEALAEENYAEAIKFADQAIASQPKEGLFWQLKGMAQFKQDDKSGAAASFAKTTQYNKDLFSGHLYLGMANKDLGKTSQAEQNLLASRRLLPTGVSSFHLGELAEKRGDKAAARSYYNEAAQGDSAIAKSAKERLQQL